MQFQIEAEKLVEAKNKIKRVVLNSSITKKTIYLKIINDELVMYAYSEGNYGEVHIPCYGKEPGFVELPHQAFDIFDYIQGVVSFELSSNQLIYDNPIVNGEINIVSDKPDLTEHPIPTKWIKLPKVIFDILYCNTKDDLNLENVFFIGDTIATTSRVAFAGYKHPEILVETPFTVSMSFFDLAPKDDIEVAFDVKKIWLKSGEFYIGRSTIDYTNTIVQKYGYYEFDPEGVPFFEITLEQAKQLCGYAAAISNLMALVLNNGTLTVVPEGSELGKGTMQIKCRSSYGEMNFGTSLKHLLNAISHVDGATCKAYHLEPQGTSFMLIDGHLTRHMFGEIPNARAT